MWNESDDREFVAFYMEKLRRGEDAFFGLIDSPGGDSIVPLLIEEYRRDADPKVRTTLINVIAQFGLRSSIPFFAEALRDTSPPVWKAALDAFFTVPCVESLATLESVSGSIQDAKQRRWFSEAIDQLREQLAKDHDAS
jgi:HEAT repeat protein